MSNIKERAQNIDPNIDARDIGQFVKDTHNIYETLTVITKRARQISVDIKQELLNKLEEFATQSETIEEVQENKEQIEISKFYERLPNPVLIATDEFLNDELHFHYKARKTKDQF